MTNSFPDPVNVPVVFTPKTVSDILYGSKEFSISFAVSPVPREADLESFVVKHMGVYRTDRDVYTDTGVAQFSIGQSQTIELLSDSSDISETNFILRIYRPAESAVSLDAGGLGQIRQPSFESNMSHTFSMTPSVSDFAPYNYLGNDYYATASLDLTFSANFEGDSNPWPPVSLPDMQDSLVLTARANAFGVLDITSSVKIRWYDDEARTIPSGTTPLVRDWPVFGLRFFVSRAGMFSPGVAGAGTRNVIARGIYPSSVLSMLGYPRMECYYWGKGYFPNDLWAADSGSIEVSDGGMAVQGMTEVAVYTLPNPLVDVYSSSSSSSTSSSSPSSNSSSSSSLNSSSSSMSSTSSSTAIIVSSSSSSPTSSSSSSSTSSSSSSSSSSSTSSSGSSYSSQTSSFSSFPPGSLVLRYSFTDAPGTMGVVTDDSGSGNDASVGPVDGGLGPPIWESSGGYYGPCYLFESDLYNTDYISGVLLNNIYSMSRGTVSFWVKAGSQTNKTAALFCISNGFNDPKTEILFGIDYMSDRLFFLCSMDGAEQWNVHTETGTASDLIGNWTNITVVHNGHRLYVYIDFAMAGMTYLSKADPSVWFSRLFSDALNPADRIVLGGVPRDFSPYMALGFAGRLDEIQIWSEPLSQNSVEELYKSSSSSSSSSSP